MSKGLAPVRLAVVISGLIATSLVVGLLISIVQGGTAGVIGGDGQSELNSLVDNINQVCSDNSIRDYTPSSHRIDIIDSKTIGFDEEDGEERELPCDIENYGDVNRFDPNRVYILDSRDTEGVIIEG